MSQATDKIERGPSPFYPNHPVPVELFVGRQPQIDRIMSRGVGQVAQGKPATFYVQGQYGIGKSSIAKYTSQIAEWQHNLYRIYVTLGSASTVEDVGRAVLEAAVRAEGTDPKRAAPIRDLLQRYIKQVSLFGIGVTVDPDALRKASPSLASPNGMLTFLQSTLHSVRSVGSKGLFLILDELNGITKTAEFAHFIKGLVDCNAMSAEPLPILLMLCGIPERRRDMIEKYEPIERVFDVVQIDPMDEDETRAFYSKAFNSVNVTVDPKAMHFLTHFSGGLPKVMHLLGEDVFYANKDDVIDENDAVAGLLLAAEDFGRKYVDEQVMKALQSSDYRSILVKIGLLGGANTRFTKASLFERLTPGEQSKFNNFIQKMRRVKAIQPSDLPGQYEFVSPMIRLYLWAEYCHKPATKASKELRNPGDSPTEGSTDA